MKRAVRALVWLYPSNWRKRYGREFEALLEDATPSLSDALDIAWGALKMRITRSVFAKIMAAGLGAGVIVATLVFVTAPKHYRSEAFFTITYPDQFTANFFEALQSKTVFSKDSLTSLIQEHDLYSSERNRMPMDAVIDEMKRNIHVYSLPTPPPGKKDEVKFVLQFDYSDRRISQEVNEALVSRFMEAVATSATVDPHPSRANFRIFDPPTLPRRPVEPNLARSLVGGLFGGLLTGLALVIFAKLHRPTTLAN